MSLLRIIIPVFLTLGLLQAGILALSVAYWRYSGYLGSIESFFFGSVLIFTAFILHPLLLTFLITFTVAPPLLSARHNLFSHLSTAYVALIPSSLSSSPLFEKSLPATNREWLMTLLSGYAGWKVLGILPGLVALLVFFALREGGKKDVAGVGRGLRGESGRERKVRETGVGLRSARTDVQVVE